MVLKSEDICSLLMFQDILQVFKNKSSLMRPIPVAHIFKLIAHVLCGNVTLLQNHIIVIILKVPFVHYPVKPLFNVGDKKLSCKRLYSVELFYSTFNISTFLAVSFIDAKQIQIDRFIFSFNYVTVRSVYRCLNTFGYCKYAQRKPKICSTESCYQFLKDIYIRSLF